MFSPAEGADPHSYGIFSGLSALGDVAPADVATLASRIKQGVVNFKPLSTVSAASLVVPDASSGGGMAFTPDMATTSPLVESSGDNTVIFVGLAVAALAIGGALYIKKRKKAAA